MIKEKVTKILLVRHAESKYNVKKILSSEAENDLGLTAKGKRGARQLASGIKLKEKGINAIYSSHLPRCLQTAAGISKAIKKKIIIDKNFRENEMGKFEMISKSSFKKKYPSLFKKMFFGDPSKLRLGETFKESQKRVWVALEKLARRHKGEKILIVTHSAPIKFVVCKIFGSLKHYNKLTLSNASLTFLEKRGKKYKLKYLNDISHLR